MDETKIASDSDRQIKLIMKNTMKYALAGALFATSASFASAAETGVEAKKCSAVYQSSSAVITQAPSKVLEHVSTLVAANEACAGDVVKAAIVATSASNELVGQIVETAVAAAPKQISKIVASAVATAPDASSAIAAVVAKMDKGTAQNNKVDPRDLAGRGTVGVHNSNGGGTFQSQGGGSSSSESSLEGTPGGKTN